MVTEVSSINKTKKQKMSKATLIILGIFASTITALAICQTGDVGAQCDSAESANCASTTNFVCAGTRIDEVCDETSTTDKTINSFNYICVTNTNPDSCCTESTETGCYDEAPYNCVTHLRMSCWIEISAGVEKVVSAGASGGQEVYVHECREVQASGTPTPGGTYTDHEVTSC
jgi:hypothetical protein